MSKSDLHIRLPEDVKSQLKMLAQASRRNQVQQVIWLIEQAALALADQESGKE